MAGSTLHYTCTLKMSYSWPRHPVGMDWCSLLHLGKLLRRICHIPQMCSCGGARELNPHCLRTGKANGPFAAAKNKVIARVFAAPSLPRRSRCKYKSLRLPAYDTVKRRRLSSNCSVFTTQDGGLWLSKIKSLTD